MVAQTLAIPNVRKMFIPEPGYLYIDIDLERADAQVVAWEAGDEKLKSAFRSGEDIHTLNAMDIYGITKQGVGYSIRQKAKVGVHAVNYLTTPRTLSKALGCTLHEAERFIKRWFSAHPEIPQWHKRIRSSLQQTRSVYNIFGYRKYFFDRIEGCMPEAVAWPPQSTVGIANHRGLKAIDKNIPQVICSLEVHDSLVLQAPIDLCYLEYTDDEILVPSHSILCDIRKHMQILIPYPDPLIIPTSMAISDKSWGDVKDVVFV